MANNTCARPPALYQGDGSTTKYSFAFQYIETSDIAVFLWNETTESFQLCTQVANSAACSGSPYEYYFTSATPVDLTFCVAPGLPPEDRPDDFSNVIIIRQTDICQMVAYFYPGSPVRAQDLNNNFTQILLALQDVEGRLYQFIEDYTGFVRITGDTMEGPLDMDQNKLTGVPTPVLDVDAVNKLYVDEKFGGDPEATAYAYVYYTATQGDTVLESGVNGVPVFAISTGLVQVYINGALQQKEIDYIADSTTKITVTQPLLEGDVVGIYCINNIPIATAGQAADVNYTYPGGVQQTVQARLEQYVSVKDFGAKGDGVTDDSTAINSAITYAATNQLSVRIPSGVYRVDSQIKNDECVSIFGSGWTKTSGGRTEYGGIGYEKENFVGTVLYAPARVTGTIYNHGKTGGAGVKYGSQVSNLFILGGGLEVATATQEGIRLSTAVDCTFTNVGVGNCATGVHLYSENNEINFYTFTSYGNQVGVKCKRRNNNVIRWFGPNFQNNDICVSQSWGNEWHWYDPIFQSYNSSCYLVDTSDGITWTNGSGEDIQGLVSHLYTYGGHCENLGSAGIENGWSFLNDGTNGSIYNVILSRMKLIQAGKFRFSGTLSDFRFEYLEITGSPATCNRNENGDINWVDSYYKNVTSWGSDGANNFEGQRMTFRIPDYTSTVSNNDVTRSKNLFCSGVDYQRSLRFTEDALTPNTTNNFLNFTIPPWMVPTYTLDVPTYVEKDNTNVTGIAVIGGKGTSTEGTVRLYPSTDGSNGSWTQDTNGTGRGMSSRVSINYSVQ